MGWFDIYAAGPLAAAEPLVLSAAVNRLSLASSFFC